MKRLVLLVLFALVASAGVPVLAQQSESRAIVQKMIERNPDLRTFQARIHVDVRMLSFPFYSPKLDGTSYFKRPDEYQVVFDRVPPFARGLDHFFSDLADPSTWERRFDITVEGRPQLNGRRVVQLKLVAKIRGMIDHTDVFIDPSSYEVARLQWHYYNGGLITMDQSYRNVGNFHLLFGQHAEIHVPHIRAVADSQYSEYHANIAVNDSVFTESHK